MKKESELLKTEKARTICFNIISALFCQPAEELQNNNAAVLKKLQAALKIAAPACEFDYNLLKSALEKYNATEMLVEYTRLFIGPVHALAPPYSGLYFGGKHHMSDETVMVVNFYKRSGLHFDEKIKDAPDHFVIETEFLYYLSFKELKELEAGNVRKADFYGQAQKEFFLNHYKKWVPQFSKRIRENTKNEYFRLLAEMVSGFINNQIFYKEKSKNPKKNDHKQHSAVGSGCS